MTWLDRIRRLWALSGSGELPTVIERTERIIERLPVPSATVDDIYVQAIARLELMPGDILLAKLRPGDTGTNTTRVLNRLAQQHGAQRLISDHDTGLSVLAFKRAERRLKRQLAKKQAA